MTFVVKMKFYFSVMIAMNKTIEKTPITPQFLSNHLASIANGIEATREIRESLPLIIRGIYQATGKKSYSNYFYDTLRDPSDPSIFLTMLVRPEIREFLEDGKLITVSARLTFRADRNTIIPRLITQEIIHQESAPDHNAHRNDLAKHYIDKRRKKDVRETLRQKLAAGLRPQIAIIYGTEAQVDKDVESAIQDWKVVYELFVRRVPMNNVNSIIQGIQAVHEELPNLDAIAVVRGGGSGLEIFDHPDLILKLIYIQTPIISALGHAGDHTKFDDFADLSLDTPTAFGHFLANIARSSHIDTKDQVNKGFNDEKKMRYKIRVEQQAQIEQVTIEKNLWRTLAILGWVLIILLLSWIFVRQ